MRKTPWTEARLRAVLMALDEWMHEKHGKAEKVSGEFFHGRQRLLEDLADRSSEYLESKKEQR